MTIGGGGVMQVILRNDLTVDGWRFYSWKYGWPPSPYAYPILFPASDFQVVHGDT